MSRLQKSVSTYKAVDYKNQIEKEVTPAETEEDEKKTTKTVRMMTTAKILQHASPAKILGGGGNSASHHSIASEMPTSTSGEKNEIPMSSP
jgi:hypothetical protein